MQDVSAKIARSRSLQEVEQVLLAQGRISDETRRALVMRLSEGRLPEEDRQAGYELVMGSLSSVLHEARCLDWWDAVLHSDDAIRAAINRKLPFKQSVISEVHRTQIMEKLLDDNRSGAAWLIWSQAMDDAARRQMLPEMFELLARKMPAGQEEWIADFSRMLRNEALTVQVDQMGEFFYESFLMGGVAIGCMDAWLREAFPNGLSNALCSRFIEKVSQINAGAVPQAEEAARTVLKPLRAMAAHATLEASTPSSAQPSPGRRI